MEKVNEITPVYVLLPVFTELKEDVFLNILKKVVARTKFGDGMESAFTSGMTAKTLFIKSEELSGNTNDETMSRQIRLSKLMGFWAVNNFPSLGRKLLGEHWNPPEGRTVTIGNQETIDDKQMDTIVFEKLKLRVIQLSVSSSTLIKIKHFVTVHANVCENNPVEISKKMKMYPIQDKHINDCWQALKAGKFIMNDSEQQIVIGCRKIEQRRSEERSQSISTLEHSSVNVDVSASDTANGPELISTAEDVSVSAEGDSASCNRMVTAVKRCHVVIDSTDSQPVSTGKRSRVANSDSVIDDLRSDMQNMAQDISKLTKWFDPEGELSESHKMIAQLQNTLAESDRMKQELVTKNEKLQEKLNDMGSCGEQIKNNLTDSNRKNMELVSENAMLRDQLTEAKCHGNKLESQLSESDKNTIEMATENAKLQEELNDVKSHIEESKKILAESEQEKVEIAEENQTLWQQMNELKQRFETMVPELEKEIQSLKKNVDEASHFRTCEVEDTTIEMSNKLAETNTEEQQLSLDCGSTLSTNEFLLESVQTSEVINTLYCTNSTEEFDGNLHLSTGQIGESIWEPEFEIGDAIVLHKFKKPKNAKFAVAEPGKKPEAQKVTPDKTSRKYELRPKRSR